MNDITNEDMVTELILNGILVIVPEEFLARRVDIDEPLIKHSVLCLYVECNDIFAWAVAECEPLANEDELKALYDMWKKFPRWGTAKWVCIKRNEQPQHPVKKDMKEMGEWDDIMEKLPPNKYDEFLKLHPVN